MKRLAIIMSAALVLSLGIGFVLADPQGGQSTVGATGQYAAGAPNSVAAEGGNVTAVNVSSDQGTEKWQGFWGNITGSLRLGDGSDVFYDWSGVQFQAVYASLDNNLDWGAITEITAVSTPSLADKDTDFGFTTADPDSIANTFSGSACAAGTIFSAASGVVPYNSTGDPGSWETCIGEDGDGTVADTVLGTDIVWAGADAYNGELVQYQLMVPAQGAGSTYYFYLEI